MVVFIVGILAAIMFPSASRMLQQSRQARCGSNLRQIGSLMQIYLGDHQGQYPLCYQANGNRFWPQEVMENAGINDVSVFICPEVKDIHPVLAARSGGFGYISYGINNAGLAPASTDLYASGPARTSSIGEPAKVLMAIDNDDPRQPYDGWYETTYGVMKQTLAQTNSPLVKRHNGTLNAVFCDGHVESLNPEELVSQPASDFPWAERRYEPWR